MVVSRVVGSRVMVMWHPVWVFWCTHGQCGDGGSGWLSYMCIPVKVNNK